MSRTCYSDDYGDDFPGQLELYRANVMRSIQSRAGQARLKELRDALVAMPDKKLVSSVLLRPTGEACALGVWAKQHAPEMVNFDGDDHDTAQALKSKHWPKLVVMDLIYMNDHEFYRYEPMQGPLKYPHEYFYGRSERFMAVPHTDEERYVRVLAWVNEQIRPEVPDAPDA